MYPVPGICPVCGDQLVVTRLHCGQCATTLEGLFTLGRFHYLNREQQQFIGIFIKCRGKIKDVEQELGLSYPTVVRLLDEVVDALGVDASGEAAAEAPAVVPVPTPSPGVTVSFERRRIILDDLSQGRISSADALRLLQGEEIEPTAPTGPLPPASATDDEAEPDSGEAAPVAPPADET